MKKLNRWVIGYGLCACMALAWANHIGWSPFAAWALANAVRSAGPNGINHK